MDSGIVISIREALLRHGYSCHYWRDLFQGARNPENIALLPMLIKKIPTFDFAVLICEGHDLTRIKRGEKTEIVHTMRDNVLFEIGLCTMALGMNRTILVTDGDVRLPDDLHGRGDSAAVKVMQYRKNEPESSSLAAEETAGYIHEVSAAFQRELDLSIIEVADNIDRYIQENRTVLAPTVIGASVSTATGYVSNFILRTLEKCDQGFILEDTPAGGLTFIPDEKIYMHIILPEVYRPEIASKSRARLNRLPTGYVPSARFRRAEFKYRMEGEEMHIIDYPTTLVTSYQTAKLILKMEADDEKDPLAEERFHAKELDFFENALKVLLSERFVREIVVHFYEDDTKEEEDALVYRRCQMIQRIRIERKEY